jgi:outer membrane protein OmpA-like peptidoglycan-associated protein
MSWKLKITFFIILLSQTLGGQVKSDAPKVQIYEEVEKGFYIGLSGGVAYDVNPPVENKSIGLLTGLELGYDITWVFRIKAGFQIENFSGSAVSASQRILPMDFQSRLFWGGASLALLATQRFYLYIQGGVGYRLATPQQISKIDVSGENDIAILAGGGMEYYPNLRNFSFAIEANSYIMPGRGDVAVAVFPMVRYTFGLGQVKVIKPPKDRDDDGIPDKEDKCPDVWGVESQKGCPEPDTDGDGIIDRQDNCPEEKGPESNSGCPIEPDTDNDGLPDKLDRCPKTPGPKDKQGCPDTDDDGIPDTLDKCPDKKGPSKNDGCPSKAHIKVSVKKKSIELREKIHFEFGNANIMQKSHRILNQVAATLRQHPEISKIRVEGHTDDRGPSSYNKSLSQRRAQSVVNYLVGQDISSDRLVAEGFGEDKPIASNNTEEGRSINRRVEMVIIERAE